MGVRSYAPRVSDPKDHVEKPESRTQIAYRCASACKVDWRTAYDVLFKNAPIINERRERVLRWAIEKRLLGPRDVVVRAPRKRAKKEAPPAPDLRPLLEGLEKLVPEVANLQATAREEAEKEIRATRAARSSEAKQEWDRLVGRYTRKGGAT